MPEIRYYTITQTREIKVSATNEIDAAVLGERVFSGTKKPEDQINVQQNPRNIFLTVEEDR